MKANKLLFQLFLSKMKNYHNRFSPLILLNNFLRHVFNRIKSKAAKALKAPNKLRQSLIKRHKLYKTV